MSFSSDIKNEICHIENISPCCYHAQVYGLVLFAHFSNLNFSIKTENQNVFDFYCDALKNYAGCNIEVNTSGSKKKIAYVADDKSRIKAFEKFGHTGNEPGIRINYANIENECCVSSFLRGAFLSCGSVSNPDKSYHLEFVVPFKKLSQDLIKIMSELDLNPKYVMRKGNHIVYFKDSENIEDFLAHIGAQNSALYLMNVKIEKDIKNNVNRKFNYEMHNFEKTISASQLQIEAIKYIKSTVGLAALPENLREIASLRLNNPESTLTELASFCEGKISKSGIKHRLDRIIVFYNDLLNKTE